MQVPTPTMVTVPVLSVQTPDGPALSATARPELAVAATAKGASPTLRPGSGFGSKVMFWLALVMRKSLLLLLPVWLASPS
ncbi:MAG: hypothetical protein U0232_01325 [Thermomicrobiales bacterium]